MTRCLFAALSTLLLASPAAAFEYMQQCVDEPTGVKWSFAEGPLTWHLSSTRLSTDLGDAEVRSAVLGAFAEWDAPACSNVPSQQGVAVAVDPFDEDAEEVVIGFYEDAWPAALGTGLLALTRIEFDATACTLTGGDIAINGADWTWLSGEPADDGTEADLQAVLTHEVGHLLGLDHTALGGSAMQYPYDYNLAWRTLGCDDSGGICDLYPSGDASCTDSTYCPCSHPCDGGFCDGLTFSDVDGECWELFLPEQPIQETEPNDEADAILPIALTGGDFRVTGSSLSCGNDQTQPTADLDWYNFDAPCSGKVFVTVEPVAGDADVDLFVYDDTELAGDAQFRDTGTIEAVEVQVGEDFQILVYCWEGSATDYELRIQYLAPGEVGEFPLEAGPEGCNCSASGAAPRSAAWALAMGLIGLIGVSRRGGRGRGGPSSPSAEPARRSRWST